MKVNLGGIVHLSTVDWIGKASLVIFLRGCPLRCPHCQNRELQDGESLVDLSTIASEIMNLIPLESTSDQITLDEAILRTTIKPFVSALILSGGEPLMQLEQSTALLRLARSYGLRTALETSGYYPDRLKELLGKNLLDKVFLDLKAALREPDYTRATEKKEVASRVLESLIMCMNSGVSLDIRITIFPEMPSKSEVVEIAKTLSELKAELPNHGLESLVLQQGRPRDGEAEFKPLSLESLNSMAKAIDNLVHVHVRAQSKAKLEKVDASAFV